MFRKDRDVASAWCLCSLNQFLILRLSIFPFLIFALERCCTFIIVINIVYLISTIKIVTVSEVLFKYQDECLCVYLKPIDKCLKSETNHFYYHFLLFSSITSHAFLCMFCEKGSVPNAIRETHSEYITLINSTFIFADLFISLTSSLTSKNLNSCFLAFFAVIGFGICIGFLVTISLITFSEFDPK